MYAAFGESGAALPEKGADTSKRTASRANVQAAAGHGNQLYQADPFNPYNLD
jgi:hypothetical protein